MFKPVVFDEVEAKKYGLIEALVIQKVREGNDTETLLKTALSFVLRDELRKAIGNLLEKEILHQNGLKLQIEANNTISTKKKSKYTELFERIWAYYNKDKENRGSKKEAFKRYNSSEFKELPEFIQEKIIDKYRSSVRDVKYMKHFATFLSGEVYEEYLPKKCTLITKSGPIKGLLMDNEFFYMKRDGTYGVTYIPPTSLEEYKRIGALKIEDM